VDANHVVLLKGEECKLNKNEITGKIKKKIGKKLRKKVKHHHFHEKLELKMAIKDQIEEERYKRLCEVNTDKQSKRRK
jgi:hypothetical protein